MVYVYAGAVTLVAGLVWIVGPKLYKRWYWGKQMNKALQLGPVMRKTVWKMRKRSQEAFKRGDQQEAAHWKEQALAIESRIEGAERAVRHAVQIRKGRPLT